MKRFYLFGVAALAGALLLASPAYADEASIYAPYSSFEELYDAYESAVASGDKEKQEQILEIGESSLKREIASSEEQAGLSSGFRVNTDEQYWKAQFPKYFNYGTWKSDGRGPNLALGPKNKGVWSESDKANGWNATYTMFRNSPQWNNRNVQVMKEQFYCHARLGYSTFAGEWNLEPWRTAMNPVTCNDI